MKSNGLTTFVFALDEPVRNVISIELLNVNFIPKDKTYKININEIERIRVLGKVSGNDRNISRIFSIVTPTESDSVGDKNGSFNVVFGSNNRQLKEFETPLASLFFFQINIESNDADFDTMRYNQGNGICHIDKFEMQIQIKYF
tara:strand:+ start:61 stop:492 length:432 start_codon:yes stop_codon:yes gene_type:complete